MPKKTKPTPPPISLGAKSILLGNCLKPREGIHSIMANRIHVAGVERHDTDLLRAILYSLDSMDDTVKYAVDLATACRDASGREGAPLLGVFAETTIRDNTRITIESPDLKELSEGGRWNIGRQFSSGWNQKVGDAIMLRNVTFHSRPSLYMHQQAEPFGVEGWHNLSYKGNVVQALIDIFVARLVQEGIHICERPWIIMDETHSLSIMPGRWVHAAYLLDLINESLPDALPDGSMPDGSMPDGSMPEIFKFLVGLGIDTQVAAEVRRNAEWINDQGRCIWRDAGTLGKELAVIRQNNAQTLVAA